MACVRKQSSEKYDEMKDLEYLISKNKVNSDGIVLIDEISKDLKYGRGDKDSGDVYYLEEGVLYYKPKKEDANKSRKNIYRNKSFRRGSI